MSLSGHFGTHWLNKLGVPWLITLSSEALGWALRGPCGDRALSGPLQIRKNSYFQHQRYLQSQSEYLLPEQIDLQCLETPKTQQNSLVT